ncbi:hypothetical protein CYLTODRAFT_422088 [Cylindrobasidium torrendii FP15055 ss-10]|uniref:Uncharacterized protein n=1 Tax=Cylindrobasidium torrendii FP15055 ss-10 TaxID=1314674 RepID=A0A0D7BCI3_9AGAR|nr:hypothetical protein CYLTODRAFT_422088 [Cylindrobasidium torrendii FP15055 ss-10]
MSPSSPYGTLSASTTNPFALFASAQSPRETHAMYNEFGQLVRARPQRTSTTSSSGESSDEDVKHTKFSVAKIFSLGRRPVHRSKSVLF